MEENEAMENDATEVQVRAQIEIENQFSSGVGWFLWIGILSIINTVLAHTNSDFFLIFGLGASVFLDGIALAIKEGGTEGLGPIGTFLSSGILSLFPPLVFLVFYSLGKKRIKIAIIIGMILYSMDAFVFLIVQDFLSFGFHIFALISMYSALTALKKMQNFDQEVQKNDTQKEDSEEESISD